MLQIELAAVVDAGKPMVESTYILEGDGTLAWQCYEQLLIIQNSIHGANLPNLTALSREVSGGNVAVAQQSINMALRQFDQDGSTSPIR